MPHRLVVAVFCLVALMAPFVRAEAPAAKADEADRVSRFDPSRHMRVSEVRPGMTGYGLTVFKGSKIDKFNVEVVSILHNFNPKCDVVLITCEGDYLKHTGSIAGMSGSPIYLKDDQGKYRMIGAFAYGWPLTKDPVAGVQPIEYMLKLPVGPRHTPATEAKATTQPARNGGSIKTNAGAGSRMSWSLPRAGLIRFLRTSEPAIALENQSTLTAGPRLGDQAIQLQPLATPLMASGMSPQLLKQFGPEFARAGLTLLEAGGGSSATGNEPAVKLEPGSALAVPLLTGDVDLTAIGTVTETIGDRVYGFGHPFNNEGAVRLPMGSGTINSVIANLQTSFKLGALNRPLGELTTDESVGVAGKLGLTAPSIPIEFHVSYSDGQPDRIYHFKSAQHPKFTPMIAGVALGAAVTGISELPQYNTVKYELNLEFANGKTIDIADTAANINSNELASEIGLPLTAASENPFERVPIRKITGNIHISSEARSAQILDVNVPRSRYRPGEKVKAYVTYKPFRQAEEILPVQLDLPRDLPEGTYQLIISDAQRYVTDTQQAQPFRFTADSIGDVFGVLKDVAAIRQNAVYIRLLQQPDGVAVGRTALANLPSSRRQILLGAGRSNITPYVNSTIKVVPTEWVMSGSAEFSLTIETHAGDARNAKTEPDVRNNKAAAGD